MSRLLLLSHSGIDTEAAAALKARILASPAAQQHDLSVWFDKDDLRAGEPWQDQLAAAIGRSHAFAVYVGSKGVVNWVEAEVRLALNRAVTEPDYRFVPILADSEHGPEALPSFAQQFQGVFEVETQPEQFERLMLAVLGGAEAGTLQLESEPFFGLRAIDETRSHLFFGREQETAKLTALVHQSPLVLVTGDSGSGKSSLVRAGLVPRFRGGALAELDGTRAGGAIWHVVTTQPRNQPFRQLGDAVSEAAKALGLSLADRGTLADWAASGEIDKVRRALRCDLPPEHLQVLLVVDQFEELLTITPPELRAPFIDLLIDLSDPADGHHRVVLTMRHDYVNLCNAFEPLKTHLDADDRRARFLLGRMSDDALRSIVSEPLRLAGIEPGDREALASEVLRDVGQRPGDLALVQMALTETWHERNQHGGDLLRAYAAVGRVEGALAQAAERMRTQVLDDDERALLDPMLLRLVRLGDTGGATRRIASRDEFDDERWALVQMLASEDGKRLFMLGGDAEHPTVEIAHEALVTAWPHFQNLLQETADDKRVLDALVPRARAWAAAQGPARNSRRPTGAELELFAGLAARRAPWLSDDERALVEASVTAQRTRHNRRKWAFRGAVAASVAFLVLALGALWFYFEARQQTRIAQTQTRVAEQQASIAEEQTRVAEERAQVATSRELAARASDTLALDAELALLLALEAIDQARTTEAEAALHRGLHANRIRHRLAGHPGPVAHVVFGPDGSRVFTASSDGTTKVWDSTTGDERLTLEHAGHYRLPFAVSPDGAKLATSGRQVFDSNTGTLIAQMEGPGVAIPHLAFSPDGKLLATAEGREARLWDTMTWTQLSTLLGHDGGIERVAFNPSGSKLATAGHDAATMLWDVATGTNLATLEGHTQVIWDLAFAPAGRRLATASADGTAKVWDALSGDLVATLRGHSDSIWGIVFDPTGTRLATASADGTARLWDATNGAEIRTLANHKGEVRRVAFSPDGRTLATAGSDATARLWDVASGIELAVLTGHTDRVWDLAFNPTGATLATASDDGTARLWDVTGGEELVTLGDRSEELWFVAFSPDTALLVTAGSVETTVWRGDTWSAVDDLVGHGTISNVAMSPDGRRLVMAGEDGTARVWDVVARKQLPTLSGHTDRIWGLAFSPDGGRVATGSFDGTIKIWNVETGAQLSSMTSHGDKVGPVAFSPDGRWLASGNDNVSVQLWDAATGAERLVLYAHQFTTFSVAFSRDGTLLATGGQDGAAIWDVGTGEEIAALAGHGGYVWQVEFSPDGNLLATASADGTVKLWQVPTGQEIATLRGHASSVEHMAFSPDGTRLATASADATVRLWDATTGDRLLTFTGHTGAVRHVAFSTDGAWLATASADGTAKVYPLGVDQLVTEARARLARTLTEAECRRYLHLDTCPQ